MIVRRPFVPFPADACLPFAHAMGVWDSLTCANLI